MLTLIIFILVIGLLVFVHEAGHFFMARWMGVKVEEFAFGFPPTIWSKEKNGTKYKINALPLGGYVKMLGEDDEVKDPRAFNNQKARRRLLIVVAGVVMNFILAYLLFVVGYMVGMTPVALDPNTLQGNKTNQVLVASVVDGSPAQKIGISTGDMINGFKSAEEFSEYTNSHRGQSVTINYYHKGANIETKVDLQGDTDKPALGVALGGSGTMVKLGFFASLKAAAQEVWYIVVLIVKLIGGFIGTLVSHGKISEEAKQVSGPVGIYTFTGQAIQLGWVYVLQLIAIISVNLGLINILPFPALDGGRAVLIFLEGVVRKKVMRREVEAAIHMVGFVLLISLILLVTYREVAQIIIK